MSGQVFLSSLVQPKWWIWMHQVELSSLRHFVSSFKYQVPHNDWNSLLWQQIWVQDTCEYMATFVLCTLSVTETTTSETTGRAQALWQSWGQTSAQRVLEGVPIVSTAWWSILSEVMQQDGASELFTVWTPPALHEFPHLSWPLTAGKLATAVPVRQLLGPHHTFKCLPCAPHRLNTSTA